jgi:chlorite dismutase
MRFLLALLLLPVVAAAQPVPATDAQAVRKVIEAQLDAFSKDDAERAFSYAAPGIQKMFGTPDGFMRMVREQYAVVYRPHSVTFRSPRRLGADLVQPVRMTDAEGHPWLVVYPMERQPDGSWRINGCQTARLPGEET